MKKKDIKIGDEVRFLNEVGGGTVSAIKGDGIIEVKDKSGFNIPVLETDVVVVTPGSTIVPKPVVHIGSNKQNSNTTTSPTAQIAPPQNVEEADNRTRSTDEAYDVLNVWMAYLPEDPEQFGNTPYEVYIVNESNYDLYIQLLYLDDDGNAKLTYSDKVAFDSSVFIHSFSPEEVSKYTQGFIRLLPYKTGEAFAPKQAYDIKIKMNASRFFKKNAFTPNDFFDDDAIVVPIIERDRAVQKENIDVQKLSEIMKEKKKIDSQRVTNKRKTKKEVPSEVVIDLHINELVDTTAGMSNKDMLDLQLGKVREVMQAHKNMKGKKIIFIHGKGDGVLRKELVKLLNHEYPKSQIQDASFQEYGFGATQVTIY